MNKERARLAIGSSRSRGMLLLPLLYVWLFGPAVRLAYAHSALVSSVPAAGEVLAQAPPEIVLEFSEAVDPGFTRTQLLDASGQVVYPGPGTVDPANPAVVRLPLDGVPDGTYSVLWRALSAVDGHITEGSVGFSVGASSPRASLLPPLDAPDPARDWPTARQTVVRWLTYAGAALLVGSLSFALLVWRPLARVVPETSGMTRLERWLKRQALAGVALLTVGSLGRAIFQAALGADVPAWRVFGPPLLLLLAGREGLILGSRLVMLVGVTLLVPNLRVPHSGRSLGWWSALALAGGVLFTVSLLGHSAASGSPLAAGLDWLHLAAMATWLGGLPPLLQVVWRRHDIGLPLGRVVPLFSRIALVSVTTLAVTGTYSAWLHVRTIDALEQTRYGQALVIKVALFLMLVGLGAINLVLLTPRLRSGAANAPSWLTRTVRVELLVGSLVLLATSFMLGSAPARNALEMARSQGFYGTARAEGVHLILRIAPGLPGENEFGVEFDDPRPGADPVPAQVLLRFRNLEMDMGEQQVEAVLGPGGRYTARGSFLSMAGHWAVDVIVRRPRFDDAVHTFELSVTPAGAAGQAMAGWLHLAARR
jgi:copper transport protein